MKSRPAFTAAAVLVLAAVLIVLAPEPLHAQPINLSANTWIPINDNVAGGAATSDAGTSAGAAAANSEQPGRAAITDARTTTGAAATNGDRPGRAASDDGGDDEASARTGAISAEDVALLNQLLDRRSLAVEAGDLDAHATSLDQLAKAEFLAVEGRTVQGAAAVGLDRYREELALPIVDLTPPGQEFFDGDVAVTLEVRRTHRIAGFDDRDHVGSLFLSFVKRPSGWLVLGDDALVRVGLSGDRELWELFETNIERRDRVIVIGTSTPARHRQLADAVEQALERFDRNWTDDWSGKVVMVVPASRSDIEALLQPVIDVSKFVAFTTLGVDRSNGWEVVAPRIVAQEANLALRDPERQVEIIMHELAHVTSVTATGPATPLWAHEGLAEWISNGRPTTTDGTLQLPDLHRFRTGSTADIREVYNQAAATMAQLAGTFGDDAPWLLFRGIGAERRTAGTADYVLDLVIRDMTGLGIEELTQ